MPVEPRSKQKSATRQRLIEAARVEFAGQGIEAATTRAIAKRAGCNEVTLFRHFQSKQKLLAAVVQTTSDAFQRLCENHTDVSGPLTENLRRFAELYTASFESCQGMAKALIGVSQKRPELTKELVSDVIGPFHERMAEYLEDAKSRGEVRADLDAKVFAEIFTASLMGGVLRRSAKLTRADRATWLSETVEMMARGIRA